MLSMLFLAIAVASPVQRGLARNDCFSVPVRGIDMSCKSRTPNISVFARFIRNIAKERGITLAQAAEMLHEIGVRGYDCGPWEADLDELAATKLKAINFYYFAPFFDDKGCEATNRICLARAEKYRIPRIMTIPPDFNDVANREVEMVRIVAAFKKFVAQAKSRGIVVTIEDYGGRQNACSYAEYLKRLLDEIPDLGYALDSGNLYYAGRGEDVLDMMDYAKPRIAHVHLKDLAQEDNRKYVSLGFGVVPNEKIVKSTWADGYDGWYTLENPVGDTYLDTARQVAVLKAWFSGF